MIRKQWLFAFFSLFIFQSAEGFDVYPNDWKEWPEYCRARRVDGGGENLDRSVTKTKIKKWSRILGPTFIHVHHYCRGQIWLKKAKRNISEKDRAYAYERASSEINYVYIRSGPDFVLYSKMLTDYAEARYGEGKKQEAFKLLKQAIDGQPEKPFPYFLYSKLLKRRGDLDGALKILEKGLNNASKKSKKKYRKVARAYHAKIARIHMAKNNYKLAKHHVDKAYEFGLRSKKLKKQLRKIRK